MKDLIIGAFLLVACLIVAIPLFLMAVPGIATVVAVWLLFRWLDRASLPDSNDKNPNAEDAPPRSPHRADKSPPHSVAKAVSPPQDTGPSRTR